MTYKDYKIINKKDQDLADGCDLCLWEDREPWETPCLICKRNAMDLYERWEIECH